MSKKILCIILIILLVLSLSACSDDSSLETIKNTSSDNSLIFLQYSHNAKPPVPSIEIPDNYAEMGNNIYAVLNDANEVVGYKKIVLVIATNEYGFYDCDANGKLFRDPNEVVEQPSATPNGITLSSATLELAEETSSDLTFTTDPENYSPTEIKWESSNSGIALVDNGKVVAVKSGECTITLTIDGKTATCVVTVTPKATEPVKVEPKNVSLSKNSASIYIGDSVTLKATVTPNEAENKNITWTSSDSNVATVYNGTVTGKASGTATITATTVNGKKATCKVTVSKKPEEPPKTISTTSISVSKGSVTLYIGENATISATVSPDNATNKNITWSSSNNAIATVSNGKITAVSEGTATITAKASGGQTATCTVTVNKKVQAFTWSVISQSDCPLNISNEFDNYILSGSAKTLAISKDGYTYVMIKVAGGNKVSVSSVSESNGKIIIKTSASGNSNCVFIKYNRENTNLG